MGFPIKSTTVHAYYRLNGKTAMFSCSKKTDGEWGIIGSNDEYYGELLDIKVEKNDYEGESRDRFLMTFRDDDGRLEVVQSSNNSAFRMIVNILVHYFKNTDDRENKFTLSLWKYEPKDAKRPIACGGVSINGKKYSQKEFDSTAFTEKCKSDEYQGEEGPLWKCIAKFINPNLDGAPIDTNPTGNDAPDSEAARDNEAEADDDLPF